jgi:DNA-binding winged helix-turn-helix (wHTH) protein/tetratricopeptide (TPR) repeat protein
MMRASSGLQTDRIFRFGLFEADPAAGTLTRNGVRVKIQDQPFQILTLLLARPGEIVMREELRLNLWPEGTYIDFDGSLNVILKRLRNTLGDDPENPRFVETVPRRGYRFIAPVSVIAKFPESASLLTTERTILSANGAGAEAPVPVESISPPTPAKSENRRFVLYATPVFCLLLLGITAMVVRHDDRIKAQAASRSPSVQMRKSVAVLGFRNLSGRNEDGWLATTLSEMLSTELAGGEQLRLVSGEDVANLRASDPLPAADTLDRNTSARIGGALNSDVLVLGSYMVIGSGDQGQLRLDVRMQDGKTGEILSETAEVGGTQELFRVVSQVGTRLRNSLGVEPLQASEQAGVLAALPLDREAARFYSLGVAKLRQFDALAAKDLLEEAAAIDPKFSLVHAMLARAWAQLGYDQKHQDEAKKAFDLSADLPRAERLLVEGEYYESLGKEEQAASVYHALFELFPDNVDYGLRLAAAQTQSGHGAQAMEVINQLRRLRAPVSDDPRIDLAEARAMHDNKQVSLGIVRSAERKATDRGQKLLYALARKEECMILIYGDQPDQGPPTCEDAYNIFLGAGNRAAAADAIRLMADGIGSQGHHEHAIETYRRALALLDGLGEHEKTASSLNNMAINYANEGDLDNAEQLYRKARFEFQQGGDASGQLTAVGNIADILYLRGDLSGAEKLYQEALQIASSVDNEEPAYVYYRLGDLNLARGKVNEAHRLAQKAIDIYAPTHGAYAYLSMAIIELGEVLETQGDMTGARAQFQQALAIQQKMGELELAAETHSELAALAIEEGRGEQAEPLVRSALGEFEKEKSDPDSSSAYTLLSRALLQQRKLDEARKAVERGAELSQTSSDPALKLPAEIQQARIDMAAPGDDSANLATAMRRLHSVVTTAKRLGYYNLECEGRLALGELELKVNNSLGLKQLRALAAEARSRGYELIARHAESAASGGTNVAENRPVH